MIAWIEGTQIDITMPLPLVFRRKRVEPVRGTVDRTEIACHCSLAEAGRGKLHDLRSEPSANARVLGDLDPCSDGLRRRGHGVRVGGCIQLEIDSGALAGKAVLM